MKLKYSNLHFTPKSVNETEYTLRATFSTNDTDRHGEVVDQSWNLKDFMLNPVVLFGHNHNQPPIGTVTELGYDAKGNLEGEIKFAAEEYPFAKVIWNLYKNGFMKSFSVGFMSGQKDIEGGQTILKDNTLLEVSTVSIPANAMALAKSKGFDVTALEEKYIEDAASIETKGEISDALENRVEKQEFIEKVSNVFYTYSDIAYRADTDITELKRLVNEMGTMYTEMSRTEDETELEKGCNCRNKPKVETETVVTEEVKEVKEDEVVEEVVVEATQEEKMKAKLAESLKTISTVIRKPDVHLEKQVLSNREINKAIRELIALKGGPGSGNHGHSGRPGSRGGSGGGKSGFKSPVTKADGTFVKGSGNISGNIAQHASGNPSAVSEKFTKSDTPKARAGIAGMTKEYGTGADFTSDNIVESDGLKSDARAWVFESDTNYTVHTFSADSGFGTGHTKTVMSKADYNELTK